jgi:hypothetical protein
MKWTEEFVIFAADGCCEQFHIVQKILIPKSKGQELCFQGLHNEMCSENDRSSRERR